MKVFIAGGSGAIGRRLVPALVEAGHDVTATTRSNARTALLRGLGAAPVVLDGLDGAAVRAAVQKARPDVVVHQMTAIPADLDLRRLDQAFEATNRLRTAGTEHLVAAAQAVGARLVVQSFAGWPYAPQGGPVKIETDPFMAEAPAGMERTLAALRHLEATTLTAPEVQGVVLRYATLYGPGTALDRNGGLTDMVRARRLPVVGKGTGFWSFLHIDDAASATVAAIEAAPAGLYNVADDRPAQVSEWLPSLAKLLGARPPLRVPVWLARPAVGPAGIHLMTANRGASNAKIKRVLGWAPRFPDWRGGFTTLLAN